MRVFFLFSKQGFSPTYTQPEMHAVAHIYTGEVPSATMVFTFGPLSEALGNYCKCLAEHLLTRSCRDMAISCSLLDLALEIRLVTFCSKAPPPPPSLPCLVCLCANVYVTYEREVWCILAQQSGEDSLSLDTLLILEPIAVHEAIQHGGVGMDINVELQTHPLMEGKREDRER